MPDDRLTRPENYAEIRYRRRVASVLMRDGGCAHCIHRETLLGRTVCPRDAARSFPLCLKDQRTPQFELDETTIGGQ